MRIHLVIDYLALAGTEKQFLTMAAAMAEAGHEVEYSVLWESGHEVSQQVAHARQRGVMLHPPMFDAPSVRHLPRIARELRRRFVQRPPDVVHSAMSSAELVSGLATHRGSQTPWVTSRRYLVSNENRSWSRALVQQHMVRRAKAVVANSSAALRDAVAVEGIQPSRASVIPNLLSASAFAAVEPASVPGAGPLVSTVANIRQIKGHGDILDAARKIVASGLMFRWVLVGGEDDSGQFRRMAREEGLPLTFVGSVPDPRPYLAASTVYAHPSWSEGMSNAILEAMAAGLPVVATDVGGTAEALAGTGVLVPPRNPMALAKALVRLLSQPETRTHMATASRERADDFRIDRCVAAHLDVYLRAVS